MNPCSRSSLSGSTPCSIVLPLASMGGFLLTCGGIGFFILKSQHLPLCKRIVERWSQLSRIQQGACIAGLGVACCGCGILGRLVAWCCAPQPFLPKSLQKYTPPPLPVRTEEQKNKDKNYYFALLECLSKSIAVLSLKRELHRKDGKEDLKTTFDHQCALFSRIMSEFKIVYSNSLDWSDQRKLLDMERAVSDLRYYNNRSDWDMKVQGKSRDSIDHDLKAAQDTQKPCLQTLFLAWKARKEEKEQAYQDRLSAIPSTDLSCTTRANALSQEETVFCEFIQGITQNPEWLTLFTMGIFPSTATNTSSLPGNAFGLYTAARTGVNPFLPSSTTYELVFPDRWQSTLLGSMLNTVLDMMESHLTPPRSNISTGNEPAKSGSYITSLCDELMSKYHECFMQRISIWMANHFDRQAHLLVPDLPIPLLGFRAHLDRALPNKEFSQSTQELLENILQASSSEGSQKELQQLVCVTLYFQQQLTWFIQLLQKQNTDLDQHEKDKRLIADCSLAIKEMESLKSALAQASSILQDRLKERNK